MKSAAFAICVAAGVAICLTTFGRSKEKQTAIAEKPERATVIPAQTIDKEKLIRDKLLQAVERAKRGDRRELDKMIDYVEEHDKGRYVTEKMLPDFISFLKDTDGQIQLLGATGLFLLKSPESKEAVFEYLKSKDFVRLEERVRTAKNKAQKAQYRWEAQAGLLAISLLGVIGDESAIPLLESIHRTTSVNIEGFCPIESALAQLGAVESIANIPHDADKSRLSNAASVLGKIRDPEKVPELMAIVNNENCATVIRDAALRALGNINTAGVPEFLLGVINNSQIPVSIQRTALITAAETGDEIFEEKLLEIADSNSEIRIEGLCGLALLKPDKYLKNIFRMIKDANEPDEFRDTLAARLVLYIPWQKKRQMLGGQKDELYACLNTNKTGGGPHDKIRVRMWRLINEVFGEEPAIVLSSKSSECITTLKGVIRSNLPGKIHLSEEELEKKVEVKFKSIVTFSSEDSEVRK